MQRMNDLYDNGHRSLSGLVTDLWRESATLVRDEAELAKTELAEKGMRALTGLVWVAAGGAVLLVGALFLLATIVAVLAMLLPEEAAPWLAPLIVGVALIPIGVALLAKGRVNLSPSNIKPEQSVRSMRKDVQVLKEHVQ